MQSEYLCLLKALAKLCKFKKRWDIWACYINFGRVKNSQIGQDLLRYRYKLTTHAY